MIISAFSTNANSPKVKMVIGIVRNARMGRTTAFSSPNTSAATTVVPTSRCARYPNK